MPSVIQINISRGGMPKLPVESARITRLGVAGDSSRNRKYHGGPNRAVCLFSIEQYDWLRSLGIDLANGSLGENFTTEGLDLQSISVGDRVRAGGCEIEITKVRTPCSNLKQWHPKLQQIIEGNSGWMAKVIEEGQVHPGDRLMVIRRATVLFPGS